MKNAHATCMNSITKECTGTCCTLQICSQYKSIMKYTTLMQWWHLGSILNEFVLSCSLVCGDVCGKFNVLYGRVRNILKKNKDFEVKLDHCIMLNRNS